MSRILVIKLFGIFGDGQECTAFPAIPIAIVLYISEVPCYMPIKNDKVGMVGGRVERR